MLHLARRARTAGALALLPSVALASLAACGAQKGSARIDVLVVEAAPGLGQRLDRLELTVTPLLEGTRTAIQREEEPTYGPGGLSPWVVPVRPIAQEHVGQVLYRFRVIGYAGDREVIRRQHRVVFVEGTRLTLLMRLDASCVGLPCGGETDRTCVEGRCVDDYVPGCTVFAGDIPPICTGMDASVDAGRDMGPALDVGPPLDAGPEMGLDAGAACGDAGPCRAGARCCGGACVDTSSDPTSCGACGLACSTRQTCRGGSCQCDPGYGDCDPDQPGCETELASNPAHCGMCGNRCGGDTPACLGGTCGTCVADSDCPGSASECTEAPRCLEGRCDQAVMAGWCTVAGSCYRADTRSAPGVCHGCQPALDPRAWTPLPAGTACEIDRCTVEATCDGGGRCEGGIDRDCDDGLACTSDFCDPERSAGCEHSGDGRSCVFEGQCVPEGGWHPNGECIRCTGGGWLPGSVGDSCEDGLFCTTGEICTATACGGGAPLVCPEMDMLDCTGEVCNEAADRCEPSLLPNRCLVGGVCYANGQWNPAAVCSEICDPARSTNSFTRTGGEGYNCGLDRICVGGLCTPCAPGRHDCSGAIGGCECAEPSRCMGVICVAPPDAGMPPDAGPPDTGAADTGPSPEAGADAG